MDHLVAISNIFLDDGGRPRDAALEALSWLQKFIAGRSVTLWRLEDDELLLALGYGTDSLAVLESGNLWRERPPAGDEAAPMWGETGVLVRTSLPQFLVHAGGIEKRSLVIETLVSAGTIAANALLRAGSAAWMAQTASAIRRERLVSALNLHEWNIARTARSFGKTRKTLYDWMAKCEIGRIHVRK